MKREVTYEQLIAPIEKQMMAVVWRIVGNAADFDDAFQEATITIWRKLRRIRRHPNPHALVLRICVNAAYDTVRSRQRRRKKEAAAGVTEAVPAADEAIDRQERRARILEAVVKLPRNQAQSILMRFMDGFSYPEVAQALGCSEATVRTHVARACRRLQPLLSEMRE